MAGSIDIRRCKTEPYVWLIVANLVLYAGYLVSAYCRSSDTWMNAVQLPSSSGGLALRPWTPLTYMFAQYEFTHLLFNMLWLWGAGLIALRLKRSRMVVSVYLTGGLAGALFFMAASALTSASHTLVGSSAAVIAVVAYLTAAAPDYRLQLYGFWRIRLLWVGVLLAFLLFAGSTGWGALSAHLGGLIAGVAWAVVRPRKKPAQNTYQQLDTLLDKVRLSGYDSLSAREKDELQRLSRNL